MWNIHSTRAKMFTKSNAPPPPPPPPPAQFQPTPPLLALPYEIRRQIYRYLLPGDLAIEVSVPWFRSHSSDPSHDYAENLHIFLVCRQMSDEALDVLYGENIFKIGLHGNGEAWLRRNFSEANRKRMRRVVVVARPMGVSYGPTTTPVLALWRGVLEGLGTLRVVGEQPGRNGGWYGKGDEEKEEIMEEWVEWLRPYLMCFAKGIGAGTVVEVDVDGKIETRDLVRECFPKGYREVRCLLTGDLIFCRGQFALQQGRYRRP